MRRFRRVHTTTNLSGCLGGVGEGRGDAQSGCPASPSPPGSSLCPHSPPPGEGTDSPLSEATGSRAGLLRQGGAQGRRAKAQCRSAGIMKAGRKAPTDTEKLSKDPAGGTDQAQRSPSLCCILGSEQSKAEAGPCWAQNNKGGGRVRIEKKKTLTDFRGGRGPRKHVVPAQGLLKIGCGSRGMSGGGMGSVRAPGRLASARSKFGGRP